MGLILMALVPFFLGAGLVLLPARLTRVREWLRAIERHRGSLTAAPDFAYRFCLRQLRPDQRFDPIFQPAAGPGMPPSRCAPGRFATSNSASDWVR